MITRDTQSIIFTPYIQYSFCIARTLLLKVVATKAATTTMETTILTVVETVEVMMNVCILMINAREMKSRIMS
jgi:hypothetical protein